MKERWVYRRGIRIPTTSLRTGLGMTELSYERTPSGQTRLVPSWRAIAETAEAPPVAEAARRFRGSVPVFMPQRGWKPADTTVNLSAAIGRKSPAGGKKEAAGKKYAAGSKRGKNCRRVGCRQHTIDEQGQVHLPSMVTTGEGERLCLSPSPDLLKRYLFQRTPPGMSVISTPMAFRSSRMRSASVKSLAFLAS